MSRRIFFLILSCFYYLHTVNGTIHSDTTHRNKRQLLFPNSTVLQFNLGIGTPTPAALININWAFQANFQLPWNRSQIPVDILHANSGYDGDTRKKRNVDTEESENVNTLSENRVGDYENDSRLYHFYKYLEGVLTGFGLNGTSCVLRSLCHLGAEPLHVDDEEDLLHEVAGFALNPKNDAEHIVYKGEIWPYIQAYERGEKLQDCKRLYQECTISLLDFFTQPHSLPSQ